VPPDPRHRHPAAERPARSPGRCGCGTPGLAPRTWTCAGGPYLHRFEIEHGYLPAKHNLGWDAAALRKPEQVARWTWLIIAAITQLRIARPAADDHRQRWGTPQQAGETDPRPGPPGFRSPDHDSRDAGTPASPPKPSKAGPGRPKGRTSTPATRHPILKKAA
jgi:hypothetical protein